MSRRSRAARLLTLALGLAFGCAARAGSLVRPPEVDVVRVIHVVDGDTVVVQRDGRPVRIRLIGVDTPEVHASAKMDRDVARSGGSIDVIRAAGEHAATYTRAALEGRDVALSYDVTRTDRYGRTLAYVWLGPDRLFNVELLCAGMGSLMTIPPNVRFVQPLRDCQRRARAAGVGLWAR